MQLGKEATRGTSWGWAKDDQQKLGARSSLTAAYALSNANRIPWEKFNSKNLKTVSECFSIETAASLTMKTDIFPILVDSPTKEQGRPD